MRITANPNPAVQSSSVRSSSLSSSTTLLQQLSQSTGFATFLQSLNSNPSTRYDNIDNILNNRLLQHSGSVNRMSSRSGSTSLHRRNSIRDHRGARRKLRSLMGTSGEFPLTFDVLDCDGGCFSSRYNVENILRQDSSVYCSSKSTNINIRLKFNDRHRGVSDATFILTKIIVKAPQQGYTAPCKEGLIFVSHEPISVEATERYDDFTEAKYKELLASGDGYIDDSWPAAYFCIDSSTSLFEQAITPNRSGKFVLVKLLRADGDANNIDLQYLGLIGATGPRSFDAGSFR